MNAFIPQAFLNELLNRCDIVEIIDERLPLRKKGKSYMACCPFHEEKTPSFTVNPNKQFYYCFGCNASGNVISFLMAYDHYTFLEAVTNLANQLHLAIPDSREGTKRFVKPELDLYQVLEKTTRYYQQELKKNPEVRNYLKTRAITPDSAALFELGYAPATWETIPQTVDSLKNLEQAGLLVRKTESNYYNRFRDRLMFPIRDRQGRVIGFGGRLLGNEKGQAKYLNSPETSIFHKGRELFGIHQMVQSCREILQIVVVEGYMDVLMLVQEGIKNTVATLGTATTKNHFYRLFKLGEEIIFCFDGDLAGRNAAWRALETCLPLLQDNWTVRFLFLPEGEDPDSFIRKSGALAFRQLIESASSLSEVLFKHLLEDIPLQTLEGKAKLAQRAVTYIKSIPGPFLQLKLMERLSELVGLDISQIKEKTHSEKENTIIKPPSVKLEKKEGRQSPMRLLLSLLIHYPNLVKSFHKTLEEIFPFELPGSSLLQELTHLLNASPPPGAIIEYFRSDPEKFRLISQLTQQDLSIPESGVKEECRALIRHLRRLGRQKQINGLLDKGKQGNLSLAEKQLLQELLTMRNSLD